MYGRADGMPSFQLNVAVCALIYVCISIYPLTSKLEYHLRLNLQEQNMQYVDDILTKGECGGGASSEQEIWTEC
jgi:hypothetical protein